MTILSYLTLKAKFFIPQNATIPYKKYEEGNIPVSYDKINVETIKRLTEENFDIDFIIFYKPLILENSSEKNVPIVLAIIYARQKRFCPNYITIQSFGYEVGIICPIVVNLGAKTIFAFDKYADHQLNVEFAMIIYMHLEIKYISS